MAKRSHHLMTALSKWQLGKLLGRGGLTTGGISWLFALIWWGRPHTIPVSLLCETAKSLSEQAGAGKTSLSWICITTLHVYSKKKPQTFQTAKNQNQNQKINSPPNKQKIQNIENKSQNNKILRYGDTGKEKKITNHVLEVQPEGPSSQRLSVHFYAPADWDEALQVHKGRRAHRGI